MPNEFSTSIPGRPQVDADSDTYHTFLKETAVKIANALPDVAQEAVKNLTKAYNEEINCLVNENLYLNHSLELIKFQNSHLKIHIEILNKKIIKRELLLTKEILEYKLSLKSNYENFYNDIENEKNNLLNMKEEYAQYTATIAELKNKISLLEKKSSKKIGSSITFSEAAESFIFYKSKTNNNQKSINDYKSTFKLFTKICGNKKISLYKRKDADHFKNTLEMTPSNHKNKSEFNENTEFLSGKTIKNHFAKMSAIFSYYYNKDVVKLNHFNKEWRFDRVQKIQRHPWSVRSLNKISNKRWSGGGVDHKTAGIIISIGSYTGMRLEEICRLRKEDINVVEGVLSFTIQSHEPISNIDGSGWHPKTKNSKRHIPICKALKNTNFFESIEIDPNWNTKEQGYDYLFPTLKYNKRSNSRSYSFQKRFSTFKTKNGVEEGICFHSFRHNVSTQLRNKLNVEDRWVDKFLGHASSGSFGANQYYQTPHIDKMVLLSEMIEYPDFWKPESLLTQ